MSQHCISFWIFLCLLIFDMRRTLPTSLSSQIRSDCSLAAHCRWAFQYCSTAAAVTASHWRYMYLRKEPSVLKPFIKFTKTTKLPIVCVFKPFRPHIMCIQALPSTYCMCIQLQALPSTYYVYLRPIKQHIGSGPNERNCQTILMVALCLSFWNSEEQWTLLCIGGISHHFHLEASQQQRRCAQNAAQRNIFKITRCTAFLQRQM